MPRYEFRSPRLYVDAPLAPDARIALDRDQVNHLVNVLRLRPGDDVLLFNGRDGEWQASISEAGKRAATLEIGKCVRSQPREGNLHFLFAPLKHVRLDYLVQKAVEMGASQFCPVLTRYTQVARVNVTRMRANVVEAAQQCGILALPKVSDPVPLEAAIDAPHGLLVFCDEDAQVKDPLAALSEAKPHVGPIAVLVGPEGGFAEEERDALLRRKNVIQIALGPRILRADTAAVAALALVQAVLGDWRAAV
ncbi:MAG TPA: 16S rRNA (uracil(1498)-N(3))-methyltransferase [Pseudolabrys sp.]|nr:16S rRNA (uracil(1498)-N(3))-methyltransferase [Pseudolabrys sp.]